jgi:hypothetical protein
MRPERPKVPDPIVRWSLWTWIGLPLAIEPGSEAELIDRMEHDLWPLDGDARRIRDQIASLAHCDNGVPVTIDELLQAIGRGRLPETCFHNGCFYSLGQRTTQPHQERSMRIIEDVLRNYLAGDDAAELRERYPQAAPLVDRFHAWLGPINALTEVQRLLLARVLLPFDFLSKRDEDHQAIHADCFEPGGRGAEIDRRIAEAAGLPPIHANYKAEYRESLSTIEDPGRRALYHLAGHIAHGLHGLSDCHHSTFRWLERWIHAIGTGRWEMGTRQEGNEQRRLGQLGYTLGLDHWLQGNLMHVLLLDLGHADIGFDPRNEILRVYAYLGAQNERTATKEWLALRLWYQLYYALHRRDVHQALVERMETAGLGLRGYVDAVLENAHSAD